MAITPQEQQNIIGLTVGLFNAAPGAQYLAELTEVYETNGNALEALVDYPLRPILLFIMFKSMGISPLNSSRVKVTLPPLAKLWYSAQTA